MTQQSRRLTDQDYRARLSQLKELGIPIDSAADPSPEPDRLILESIDPEFARLYELSPLAIFVVAPARLIALSSGISITKFEMTSSLEDWPLEMDHPEEWESYKDIIDALPTSPANVLNHRLTEGRPLPRRREDGVFLGRGWCKVPAQLHDEMPLKVTLWLLDDRSNEICTEFDVRLDRSLRRMYERRAKTRRENARPAGRGLFAPRPGSIGDQNAVTPEKSGEPNDATSGDDAERRNPN